MTVIPFSGAAPEPENKQAAVPIATWRRLYDLAAQVRALAPWEWMEETDIFGVRDGDCKEILFVSVMGFLGEYHAVAVYPGAAALESFWGMQRTEEREDVADLISEIHHVHAAFDEKKNLGREEKKLIKELGLTFKGPLAYPSFRSFRPGWYPWMADAQEARWLEMALEQLLVVAPRVQKDRRLLGTGGAENRYFVRARFAQNPTGDWQDSHVACPLPAATMLRVTVPNDVLDSIRSMRSSTMTVELDVFPTHAAVGGNGERPQTPFVLLAVEADTGLVLGMELLSVDTTFDDMRARVPEKALEILHRCQTKPACIAMRKPWGLAVMDGVCKNLDIAIKPVAELPSLSEARSGLERYMKESL